MFRISNFALNARVLLLHRCHSPIEVQAASVTRLPPLCKKYKPAERATCPPPPPPPPPPPKDRRLLLTTMAMLILTGGFAVFAKDKPDIRDWLSMNMPWFDDFIAIMYQENLTYKEHALRFIERLKKPKTDTTRPTQCSLDGKLIPTVPAESGPEDGDICDIIPTPGVVDICDIERCVMEYSEVIMNNYITARDACGFYNREVEETMSYFTLEGMAKLHDTQEERIELVQTSLANVEEATDKLDRIIAYFECSVKAPKPEMDFTKNVINDCRDKIKILNAEYQWIADKTVALDDLFARVECFVLQYVDELTTMIPGVDFKSKYPAAKMTGDPDFLLFHTFRYLQQLENDLAEGNDQMTIRVQSAPLSDLPEKQTRQRDKKMQYAIAAGIKEMDRDFAKRLCDLKAANDKALRDGLKKQSEKLDETLKLKLALKEKEATVKVNKLIADKVASELKLFKIQLDEMQRKLKLVEEKLAERLKAEAETKRSQELYMAGSSLLAATRKGDPIVKVDREIKAIEKASGTGDRLMQTVLKAIPQSVRENGIVPENILRERYSQMETVAMRVALVEADGAPLPVYILSFVQSLFLFMKLSGIPRAEIEKPPQVPSKDLDTFDLLQRARYWIETGNLAMALRYVNSLQGASRAAAAWWYEAARDHLETKQAAEAVVAHAAAMGLQYI